MSDNTVKIMLSIISLVMRFGRFILLVCVFLAGCVTTNGINPGQGLTPYHAHTPVPIKAQATAFVDEAVVPAEVSTPEPMIHVVALGETISSIALKYGVTIDAIIVANPGVQPTVMVVGDELIIPTSTNNAAPYVDPDVEKDIQMFNPVCHPALDGFWCTLLIENAGNSDLADVIISMTLYDANGNVMAEQAAPTAMRYVNKDNSIPAGFFFNGEFGDFNSISTSVLA